MHGNAVMVTFFLYTKQRQVTQHKQKHKQQQYVQQRYTHTCGSVHHTPANSSISASPSHPLHAPCVDPRASVVHPSSPSSVRHPFCLGRGPPRARGGGGATGPRKSRARWGSFPTPPQPFEYKPLASVAALPSRDSHPPLKLLYQKFRTAAATAAAAHLPPPWPLPACPRALSRGELPQPHHRRRLGQHQTAHDRYRPAAQGGGRARPPHLTPKTRPPLYATFLPPSGHVPTHLLYHRRAVLTMRARPLLSVPSAEHMSNFTREVLYPYVPHTRDLARSLGQRLQAAGVRAKPGAVLVG